MNINITANNSSVSNHSQLIGSVNENNVRQAHQGQEEEILNELRAIREKLASAEELSSQLAALEQAIRESNQPKIRILSAADHRFLVFAVVQPRQRRGAGAAGRVKEVGTANKKLAMDGRHITGRCCSLNEAEFHTVRVGRG